ncbi:MAG: peroxiredoxin [Candidatus Marinimicrobia bacterium]|nr:peroxiredoxin [Candidatus Neomarinimicrobiota bacterium]MCF7850424.1 peroxiredoxin [Candidatus Neomarinimicrobiota bacterium]MCF7905259.1 peroxiredoxin [Candidatus Neomarinimicrobiota bacterium]
MKEACSIRDDYESYSEKNIKVFGISYDSIESHRKFKEKHQLSFTLLSDSDKQVSRLYGTYGWVVAKRKTFLINKEGVIFKVYESVDVNSHGSEILEDFEDYYETDKP